MTLAVSLFFAYLLGSVPFAVVFSKAFGLADPRSFGSGNPGATNVLRTGNKLAALLTLLGDSLKGALAVMLARLLELPELSLALVGLAAFLGHLYPVFLRFKGGKGVATGAGVLLAINPLIGLSTLATWLIIAMLTRYSSLAAIIAAGLSPIYFLLSDGANPTVLVVGLLCMALIGKHWLNIQRLMAGTEPKIGNKKKIGEKEV